MSNASTHPDADADANENEDTKKTHTKGADAPGVCVDPDVESIYRAYPRHRGKPSALRAIGNALKKIPAAELLEKTKAYAKHCQDGKLAPRFIPYPATWFNDERFNDPLEQTTPANEFKAPGATAKPEKEPWTNALK